MELLKEKNHFIFFMLFNATEVCQELGGGGHAAAAGCTVEASWDEAKRRILAAISHHAPDYES